MTVAKLEAQIKDINTKYKAVVIPIEWNVVNHQLDKKQQEGDAVVVILGVQKYIVGDFIFYLIVSHVSCVSSNSIEEGPEEKGESSFTKDCPLEKECCILV